MVAGPLFGRNPFFENVTGCAAFSLDDFPVGIVLIIVVVGNILELLRQLAFVAGHFQPAVGRTSVRDNAGEEMRGVQWLEHGAAAAVAPRAISTHSSHVP